MTPDNLIHILDLLGKVKCQDKEDRKLLLFIAQTLQEYESDPDWVLQEGTTSSSEEEPGEEEEVIIDRTDPNFISIK
tara:strand:+ start:7757 stop:7987 length:231 start_codon:yes stop_codon:yes gene_type:complete